MSDDDRIVPLPRKRKTAALCPVCGAPAVAARQPFCSTRCAEVDLGRWLKGTYRIPTAETPPEGEAPDEDES
ncbi:MAG: DNA gyrase inhibitor YacG [Rhodospirillales bacterium]|nr:DNA gyrase inhibitor YacG [Rhodospirillales bacterium]MDH3791376.1 DNA gyrase inhibitor YacG [Rhodospirillales bacterium]MDH3912790.1 DNA gyrase inhibitor YacG [Rhodospirillales bacterium]MDH3916616.1 DNA gyrase inhibitor YacG [Rhodospirillales bacterium]MDH3965674.1 DNA gyrase inhibitor YacG [Rhodospirillales bacterium]